MNDELSWHEFFVTFNQSVQSSSLGITPELYHKACKSHELVCKHRLKKVLMEHGVSDALSDFTLQSGKTYNDRYGSFKSKDDVYHIPLSDFNSDYRVHYKCEEFIIRLGFNSLHEKNTFKLKGHLKRVISSLESY